MGGQFDLPFSFGVFMEDINDYVRSSYVIRRKLAELKFNGSHYRYFVGNFEVKIFPHEIQDVRPQEKLADNLMKYKTVDVTLWEENKRNERQIVRLLNDSRFCNYEPIQYNVINTPNAKINSSNGDNMPIFYLCELIKYLHKLSKLSAFV